MARSAGSPARRATSKATSTGGCTTPGAATCTRRPSRSLGLFNNRPHFSRALDPDLTTVAMNEFRVAGARSEHDPWFSISKHEASWLSFLPPLSVPGQDELSPELLRRALMTFLMAFQHRPNPSVIDRFRWSDSERRGAAAFLEHCERCHQARLASDDPATRAPFDRWESLVMSGKGRGLGDGDYQKTGVVPYVHDDGAASPRFAASTKSTPTSPTARRPISTRSSNGCDSRPSPSGTRPRRWMAIRRVRRALSMPAHAPISLRFSICFSLGGRRVCDYPRRYWELFVLVAGGNLGIGLGPADLDATRLGLGLTRNFDHQDAVFELGREPLFVDAVGERERPHERPIRAPQ